MKTTAILFDGGSRKAFAHQSPDGSTKFTLRDMQTGRWNEFSDGTMTPRKAFAAVAFYRRVVSYRAGALAIVPYTINRRGQDDPVYDSDSRDEPPADLVYLDGFAELIYKYMLSLIQEAVAYVFRQFDNGQVVELRYLIPTSMKPKYVKEGGVVVGLSHFERLMGAIRADVPAEDVICLFAPSPYNEIGVPHYANRPESDGYATATHASSLYEREGFVERHLKNGLIGGHIATGKDGFVIPPKDNPERNLIIRTIKSIFGGKDAASESGLTVLNNVDIQKVGEGFEGLAAADLTTEEREAISAGVKVPYGLVMSSSAKGIGGGGVMASLEVQFIETTVKPDGQLIAGAFNRQHFREAGYYMRFEYERLNALQDRQLSQVQAATRAVEHQVLHRNEAREILGRPPMDEFDALDEAEMAADAEKTVQEIKAFRLYVKRGRVPDGFKAEHAAGEIVVIKARLAGGESWEDAFAPPFFHET